MRHSQSSNDQRDRREDDQDLVQTHALYEAFKYDVERIEQTRRQHCLAKGDTAHGEEYDTPVERVEVVLSNVSSAARELPTFERIPVPKKANKGMIAITPISPTHSSSDFSAHHRAMVMVVTINT